MHFGSVPAIVLLGATVFTSAHAANRIDLKVGKGAGGDLQLDWQDTCGAPGTDYGVHEGSLGAYPSHTSVLCSTGGVVAATVSPPVTSTYYLVVPQESGAEGSYGVDSDGTERGVGTQTCTAQQVVAPCLTDNFVDAEPARLARLDTVLTQAAAIIQAGGSYTQVADMLALESDVDGVYANGISMYFRVGGLSTSIYDAAAARHGAPRREVIPPAGGSAAPPASGQFASTSTLLPANAVPPVLPRGQRMVGEDDDGDGFRDLPKHARILAPYAFDFGENEAANVVKTILDGVRDYENNVTLKSNAQDLITNTLHLDDYLVGWEDLDIIHISSHGDADPDAFWGPDPYLFLGIGGANCTDIAAKVSAQVPDPARRTGLYCGLPIQIGPDSNPIDGFDTFATRAFWQNAHGGQLRKKLIFMDTCRSGLHPGLSEALTGEDSIFLGWSESVEAGFSYSTAEALIRDTAEDAFPVLRAFVRQCDAGQCIDPDAPSAQLLAAWDRADLRTREALTVPVTPTYGFCGVSPTIPVEQTCPSCGGAGGLSVSFSITVEGVLPEEIAFIQDPIEFAFYQLRLFADVDDVESGYALPLTDLTMVPVGDGVYADAAPGAMLAMDSVCPYQIVEYNPWILLPAFDEALPGNDNRDRTYSWDGPFFIEIDPVQLP